MPARSSLISLSGAITCLLLAATCIQAVEWPQWRGPDRDGKSAETGLIEAWPAGGLKLAWQTNDLGQGYSTPSVADGQLFLLCNEDESHEAARSLSLENGDVIWSTRIGAVGQNRGPQYPGARSTPTFDEGAIYTLGSAGDLACLDAKTGAVRWRKSLPADFGGRPGNWAYSESPLIDGEALIVSPGGSAATVVALNKADGSLIWKSGLQAADEASYSSPVIATIDGVKQYVFFLAKGAAGLRADGGKLIWRYTRTADEAANVQTPVVRGDLVYTAASRVGGALVRAPGQPGEVTELYFRQTAPKGMGGTILVDGNLYGSSGQTLVCMDFASGRVQWQDRSIGAASLCYADGKLFLHGENNEVAIAAADPAAYRELGRMTLPNAPDRGRAKAWVYPVVADGKLLIRDVGTVWCYDVRGPEHASGG